MKDHFAITSTVLPASSRVVAFKGREGLSRLYEFTVDVLVPDEADLELEDAVGGRATLKVHPETGFAFHGIIAALELMNADATHSLFRVTLVPRLWQLTLNEHSRVFIGETAKEIITDVLTRNELLPSEFELRTSGAYEALEHVCQYHESDFAFVSRLMEREGLYYFFEHEGETERLVITDAPSFHKPLLGQPVRYYGQMGSDSSAGASLSTFRAKRRQLPKKVQLKDYDHEKPSLDVAGSAPVSADGNGEVTVYGENFTTPEAGKRLAQIRAEEILVGQVVYTGDGRVYGLRSGYTFALDQHPRASLNTDYLPVAVTHHGNQSAPSDAWRTLLAIEYDEPYHVQVECILATTQFRAPRLTRIPRVYGTEEAVIDAKDGHPYAELDDHGRYRLKLNLDESELHDGEASKPVRMLQPHGGDIEGFHFPLRKGTPVHVVFHGGDPDRPVIAGAAHNAENPSVVTRANATQSMIRSGGDTRVVFEDRAEKQAYNVTVPFSNVSFTMGSTADGNGFSLHSGGMGHIETAKDLAFVSHGRLNVSVHKNVHETYEAKKTTEITGEVREDYADKVTQHYGGHHSIKVLAGGRKELVTGLYDQHVVGTLKQKVDGLYDSDVDGARTLEAKGVTWEIKGPVKIKCTSWDVEQEQEVSWSHLGNIQYTNFANKVETTFGMTTEAHLGLKNDLIVGGYMEHHIGGNASFCVGAKSDVVLAAQMELNAGPTVGTAAAEGKATEAKISKLESELKKCLTAIENIDCCVRIHQSFLVKSTITTIA